MFVVVVVVVVVAVVVVALGNLCRRLIAPNCCTVSPTLVARCRSDGHACRCPESGSSPGHYTKNNNILHNY